MAKEKKEKKVKIEQLPSISVQGTKVEDKVRGIIGYLNENEDIHKGG